jgi:flagellar basal body-associated protein FliL
VVELAIKIIVLIWAVWLLLLGIVIALAVAFNKLLNKARPSQNPAPTEKLRRIGAEACQAIEQLSEEYLREVENLFNDHPRR